ncbi:MAG: ABC transporter permease [Rhodothermia bacterium]|nr:MAG: ABC transporter permease [Rhodothermia bacterium]
MVKNYLSVFVRNLLRQKGFSSINILGLVLGFASFTLITIYLSYENGFDRFHDGSDRLYRVNKIVTTADGQLERHALTPGLLAPALSETFPEIEASTRVQPWFDDILLSYEKRAFMTSDVAIVDSNFFNIFGFELLRGDKESVLSAPLSIVLTESTAGRLFGDTDPIGLPVLGLENLEYVVTGIAADPDPKSHLRFSALISWSSTMPGGGGLEFAWLNRWITQAPFTYAKLVLGSDPKAFESKLPEFYAANDPERASRYKLYLQPIQETYLDSMDLLYAGNTNRGSARDVSTFSILRFLILLIAGINFINLSTARGSSRSKEVGIRKALGAQRQQLRRQFLLESVSYSLLALIIALLLVLAIVPVLGEISRIAAFESASGPRLHIVELLVIAVGFGILSGVYPAISLSRFHPVRQLSGFSSGSRALFSRNVFVLVQFSISMILVAGTMVVLRQLNYLQSRDKGFNQEQLIVLSTDDTSIQSRFSAFTAEVERHPAILSAAGSNSVPGTATMTTEVIPDGVETGATYIANIVRLDDYSLLDTYRFELADGRFFDENRPTDASRGIVINESMMRSLGWQEAVGRRLDISGELQEGVVIGVVKDFHFQSMRRAIDPLAFYFAPRGEFLTVRIAAGSEAQAIEHLESTWKSFESLYPFTYTFLDESFARFYESENRLMILLTFFAGLALFIASLGLYGLAAYLTTVRTKEIGVRKVLGASIPQIVLLFVSSFGRLVALAIVIGSPVVFLGAQMWLENFAYRTELSVDIFLVSGGIVLGIALLSVSYQPIRAALTNPVKALRYE